MTLRIRLERSESMIESLAARASIPAGTLANARHIDYDTAEGMWVQFTYETLRTQDGTFLLGVNDAGEWVDPEGGVWSDLIIVVEREISPERTWSVPCHMQVKARTAEEAIELVAAFSDDQAVIVRFSKTLNDDEAKGAATHMVQALPLNYGGAAQVLVWVNCDALESEATVV